MTDQVNLSTLADEARRTEEARDDLVARARLAEINEDDALAEELWDAAIDMHVALQEAQGDYISAAAESDEDS